MNRYALKGWTDLGHVPSLVQGRVEVGISSTWVTWTVSGGEVF